MPQKYGSTLIRVGTLRLPFTVLIRNGLGKAFKDVFRWNVAESDHLENGEILGKAFKDVFRWNAPITVYGIDTIAVMTIPYIVLELERSDYRLRY